MTTKYRVALGLFSSDRDTYEGGCVESGAFYHLPCDVTTEHETITGLLEEVRELWTDGNPEAEWVFDPIGDSPSRADLCWSAATADGFGRLDERDIEAWKAGEREMFYCVLTIEVEKVTTEPADLLEALGDVLFA